MSDVDSVILAVSDQPYVSSGLFAKMLTMKDQSGKRIVASSYAGTLGTPVLFDKEYFNQLKSLDGNQGAKNIVNTEYVRMFAPLNSKKEELTSTQKRIMKNLISEIQ